MFTGFKALSANFTPTPNQFFDEVVGYYPCRVVSIVAILIRSTLGWEDPDTGERRVEAELPLSAFLRPDLSESSARRGLGEAIEAGLVVRTASASSREGARYALRWNDGDAQARAIERARRATNDPLLSDAERGFQMEEPLNGVRGLKSTPLNNSQRGVKLRGLKSTPPYIDKINQSRNQKKKKEQTLNVGQASNFVAGKGPKPSPENAKSSSANLFKDSLTTEVTALVEELQDWGSERRHRQLLSVCQEHNLTDLPRQALHATRQRLAKEQRRGVVEKPGAYFTVTLLKLLAQHEVFVSTPEGKAEVRAELGLPASATQEQVQAALRASLNPDTPIA